VTRRLELFKLLARLLKKLRNCPCTVGFPRAIASARSLLLQVGNLSLAFAGAIRLERAWAQHCEWAA